MDKSRSYKIVDAILWNDWDPIGVNDIAPRDEYQGYVPEICSMLLEDKTMSEIADRLNQITTDRMGLFRDVELDKLIAAKLIDAKTPHNKM